MSRHHDKPNRLFYHDRFDFPTSNRLLLLLCMTFIISCKGQNPACYICNNDPNSSVTIPDATIDLSFIPAFVGETATCSEISDAALNGLFFADECALISSSSTVQTTCGCSTSSGTPAPVASPQTTAPIIGGSPTFAPVQILAPTPFPVIVTPAPIQQGFPTFTPTSPFLAPTLAPTFPFLAPTFAPTFPPVIPTPFPIVPTAVVTPAPITLPTTPLPTNTAPSAVEPAPTSAPSARIPVNSSVRMPTNPDSAPVNSRPTQAPQARRMMNRKPNKPTNNNQRDEKPTKAPSRRSSENNKATRQSDTLNRHSTNQSCGEKCNKNGDKNDETKVKNESHGNNDDGKNKNKDNMNMSQQFVTVDTDLSNTKDGASPLIEPKLEGSPQGALSSSNEIDDSAPIIKSVSATKGVDDSSEQAEIISAPKSAATTLNLSSPISPFLLLLPSLLIAVTSVIFHI